MFAQRSLFDAVLFGVFVCVRARCACVSALFRIASNYTRRWLTKFVRYKNSKIVCCAVAKLDIKDGDELNLDTFTAKIGKFYLAEMKKESCPSTPDMESPNASPSVVKRIDADNADEFGETAATAVERKLDMNDMLQRVLTPKRSTRRPAARYDNNDDDESVGDQHFESPSPPKSSASPSAAFSLATPAALRASRESHVAKRLSLSTRASIGAYAPPADSATTPKQPDFSAAAPHEQQQQHDGALLQQSLQQQQQQEEQLEERLAAMRNVVDQANSELLAAKTLNARILAERDQLRNALEQTEVRRLVFFFCAHLEPFVTNSFFIDLLRFDAATIQRSTNQIRPAIRATEQRS